MARPATPRPPDHHFLYRMHQPTLPPRGVRGQIAPSTLLILCAVASFASVGAALVAQYRYDMQPCPWCILQRVIFVAIGVLSVIGLGPLPVLRKLLAALIALLAGAGIVAALYQHFVAAQSNSCALTFADRIISGLHLDTTWPSVFAVRASCADAAVSILGVPFEFWSLALFVVLDVIALRILLQRRSR